MLTLLAPLVLAAHRPAPAVRPMFAIDALIQFRDYNGTQGTVLKGESQIDLTGIKPGPTSPKLSGNASFETGDWVEPEDYSFDLEQVLNIGSQSTGAGAGKVTFNPLSLTLKMDANLTPKLYAMACAGTPFSQVELILRKSSGAPGSAGQVFADYIFKLVAVKTISVSHDDESPKLTVTLEYGGLIWRQFPQKPDGTLGPVVERGWNRVKNIAMTDKDTIGP